VWRDLLLARIDPRLMAQPKESLQRIGSIVPALKAVWIYLVFGLIGILVLATGVWLISKRASSGPWGEITSALGVFGVTAASLSAHVKASANSLVNRIREAIQVDDVVESCTRRPPQPNKAKVKEPGRLALPGSMAAPVNLDMLNRN
jgi:hypothetical protein